MTQDPFRISDGRTLEQAASDLVQREVLCCMSSMVATLAAGSGSVVHSGDLQNLAEQALELSAPVPDYEEAARESGWVKDGPTLFRDPTNGQQKWTCSGWEELCLEFDITPHDREVFEHWAVSTWFAEKLTAAGERVDTDFSGLCVWARTTTGQAIHADAVVERIAREMHAVCA